MRVLIIDTFSVLAIVQSILNNTAKKTPRLGGINYSRNGAMVMVPLFQRAWKYKFGTN